MLNTVEINAAHVIDCLVSPDEQDDVREAAKRGSVPFRNITFEDMRQYVLEQVVGSWFNTWFWKRAAEAVEVANEERDLWWKTGRHAEDWFLGRIREEYPILADQDTFAHLIFKLNDVFHDGDYTEKEIAEFLAMYATKTYNRGIISIHEKMTVDYRKGKLYHTYTY